MVIYKCYMTDGISGINHMEYNERNEPTVWAESPDNQALFVFLLYFASMELTSM